MGLTNQIGWKYMGETIYARPLPRVYTIFLFAIEFSANAQHTTTGPRAPGVAPPPRAALLLCTLGRGWAYISDMS